MELLRSRFRFNSEHAAFITLVAFSALFIVQFAKDSERDKNSVQIILAGIAFIGGLLYMGYKIFSIPAIVCDYETITLKYLFRSRTILWSDIREIKLTGKENRGFFLDEGSATVLMLKDGGKIILWPKFYSNMPEIRSFLEKKFATREAHNTRQRIFGSADPVVLNSGYEKSFQKFAGHAFLNLDVIICTIFSIFFIWIMTGAASFGIVVMLIMTLFILFFYLILAFQLYYFLVSDQQLIIRNHFLPWKVRIYNLSEIRELMFENPSRKSRALRIITHDFEERVFTGGSLFKKHWKSLRARLEQTGIPVTSDLL